MTYRSVAVSGEESALLRDAERLFRRLAAGSGSPKYAVYADSLDILVRRYERAETLASLRDEIIGAPHVASVTSLAEAAERRRRMHSVPGGSVA